MDRLVGHDKFEVEEVFAAYVPWLIGFRKEIVVLLDWTKYAGDGHSRIAINLVTGHGWATPLVWITVKFASLKDHRNDYEDELLLLLSRVVPEGIKVTVLADRGLGDEKLYRFLQEELHWDYIIRFRGGIAVESQDGENRKAKDLVPPNGRIRELPEARVTHKGTQVGGVVLVKKRRLKEAWHLATSLVGQKERAVKLYGHRFTCEETFRDEKDGRFEFGFKQIRVSTCEGRDRFPVISALVTVLFTLLGAAGERLGLNRHLKSNTACRRIHSLFRQGRRYLHGVTKVHVEALRELLWTLAANQHSATVLCGSM